MQGFDRWVAALQASIGAATETTLKLLPRLLGAVALLVLGWLAAAALRAALLRVGNALISRLARRTSGEGARHDPLAQALLRLFSTVLFWVVVFAFVLAAFAVLELETISAWLDRAIGFAPSLLLGLLVIVAGYLASVMARDVVRDALAPTSAGHGRLLSRIAQATIFVTALIVGVGQLGINISFLTTVLSIALAAVLASFALAFGLGARELVSDLIAARSIQQTFEPGQTIRVGEHAGRLLEIGTRHVSIDAPEGRVVIPASGFIASVVVVATPGAQDDESEVPVAPHEADGAAAP
ncbi:MAG: mechanosensitive ion channel family protein [Burkholderiaceae bacterium]|nr:mechanosensitive ion channel family protein [Burkholderiaceae bacterium]